MNMDSSNNIKNEMLPYGRQAVEDSDVLSVVNVLNSKWLTQGPKIKEFEDAVADYCGAKYAVTVSNGTAALHLACLSAELGNGDRLWTSPNTFVATANCAIYCNAQPDFVDIDPCTYNISVDALEAKLCESKKLGTLPKVVIPVHFAGQSCEMERIYDLRDKYGFRVIEDASHAIGSSFKGFKVGGCKYSDMAVFSFHPVKIITTGEGGMVLTNDSNIYQKLLLLRTHGITRDEQFMDGDKEGDWYYQQIELGMNYRMTDIQAALGLSQLNRIDQYISRRHQLAKRYNEAFDKLPITLPCQHSDSYSALHLYVIRLKLEEIQRTRKDVFDFMRRQGIGVNVHYIPVHTHPYYQRLGFFKGQFPEAEKYYDECMTLPLFPGMRELEQDTVIDSLRKALSGDIDSRRRVS